MSFQSKGFWMAKDAGCLTDGEISYDSTSRSEPKRSHQWLVDGAEAELFPNKKQAVEVPSSSSFAGLPPSTLSPWENVSGFNSVPSQQNERLFDTDAARAISFDEGNTPAANAGALNLGRKVMEDHFGSESSFVLSMSQSLDSSKLGNNFGGIRKVKVSEVRDSENLMPISMGLSYTREGSVISTAPCYTKVDNAGMSTSLTYGREEDNLITLAEPYGREDCNFISMGHSFNKGDGNAMVMRHSYKTVSSTMPMTNSFGKAESNIMSIAENFSKVDNNIISMGSLSKGDDHMISMGQAYKGDSSVSVSDSYDKGNESTLSMAQSNNKGESRSISMGPSFDKGESNIISFGGHDDDADASGRLMCSYDLLMGQAPCQRSDSFNQKNSVVLNANTVISAAQVLSSGGSSKKKEDHKSTKKIPPNNFPSNVRSLLSTGILDEVPVKYVAWSREKELRGIIKGSGYLCGCQSCNFSKIINAYEFERHAACKTKHPNNHIYFENGKTIYGIVQELRSTPQNMLFDVIQTITGSPINQKSFRLWKESFLAATRELQRIYGKDERNQTL